MAMFKFIKGEVETCQFVAKDIEFEQKFISKFLDAMLIAT